MKPAIEVRGVWKQYNKGIDRRYKSLRGTLVGLPSLLRGEDTEKFWALEDINFDVMPGESVGIIGRNGAGKSTLLKILSRITPPTRGEIILRGRVASLLEVGTGFHPELTGRENIYFNGSILGMKYAEIRKKFDEIVDFSGVESFIDTPLKHYSSGMQMRLAFSVAAHLDTEILLIDEVLAVGDADFQKKCIGKMDVVSKGEGKTILFVSHEISNLTKICNKGIILDKAKITLIDSIWEATDKYLQNNISHLSNQPISGINIVVENFGFDKLNFKKETNSHIGNNVNIYLEFLMREKIDGFSISIDIRNKKNELIAHIINEDDDFYLETNKLTKYQIELSINNINLINDTYFIDLWFGSFHSESLLRIERCLKLNILTSEIIKRRTPLPKHSKVFLESKWKSYDF